MAFNADDAGASGSIRLHANGLAYRLRREVSRAFAAIALLGTCALDVSPANGALDHSALGPSSRIASRAFARYYRIENSAVADAYIERARTRGLPIGPTETCRLVTGTLSLRPSVLSNPPLSVSAIRQRERAIAVLGAYLVTATAVAERAQLDVVTDSVASLRAQVAQFASSANQHGQGDLFIVDIASEIVAAVARLEPTAKGDDMVRNLEAADLPIRRMAAILHLDAAQQRKATLAAASLAYATWRAGEASPSPPRISHEIPFCSEPPIFALPDSDSVHLDVLRPTTASGVRLWSLLHFVKIVDPASIINAMTSLDDANMRLLHAPTDVGATALAREARERLEAEVKAFAWGF